MHPYDRIAAFYDLEHDELGDDLALYAELIRDGPVLEIGAGSGRIMARLLESGFRVTGVEPSEAMRERATARLTPYRGWTLVDGSFLDVELSGRFKTVVFGLNALWHFADLDDQVTALRRAAQALEPAGMLVVDVSNPLALVYRESAGEVRERFRKPFGGGVAVCWAATWDDPGAQLLTLHLGYDVVRDGAVDRTLAEVELRYVYQPELELMARLAGLVTRQVYGSYELDPYSAGSPQIILVAENPERR